ncbi:hypothetical protein BHM03_00010333 [Ensete ventricosum]|nr:hypothetical protein BHM03_00010333 [Ensete ventricosum]
MARATTSVPEVVEVLAETAPRATSGLTPKRPFDGAASQPDDSARFLKRVKTLFRIYKSRHGEGGSRSHSKDKESIGSCEEPKQPLFHRPKSMKEICGTLVWKDEESLMGVAEEFGSSLRRPVGCGRVREGGPSSAASEGIVYAPLRGASCPSNKGNGLGKCNSVSTFLTALTVSFDVWRLVQGHHFQMALFDRVHDAGQLIIIMDYQIANLQQEIEALKSGGGPEVVATTKERVAKLEKEVKKLKAKRDEAFRRLEASNKELNDTQVSYEYGYRVALARFRALHMNSDVEEDSFTILPDDDSIPIETQQLFNDSDPLKP